MTEKQIITLAVLGVIFSITLLWWYRNQRGSQKRGTIPYTGPTRSSRASDLKILTPQEERIAHQAAKLASKGKVKQAAHLYEQVGLHREAISILENAGLINDAARVLLRMQKPGRAAVIYSRNRHFKEAAQCYLQAGQASEAASCLKEAGLLREAAELYAKEGQFEQSADCYEASRLFLDASRIWSKAHKSQKSKECLLKYVFEAARNSYPNLTSEEFDVIFELAKVRRPIPQLIVVLVQSPKIAKMILDLVTEKNVELATELLKKSPEHISGTLISEVNIQSQDALALASIFAVTGQDRYAAILYEQSGDFKSAAESFEKAGDTDRAHYCLERLGIHKPKSSKSDPPAIQASTPSETPHGNFFIETGSVKLQENRSNDKLIPLQNRQEPEPNDAKSFSDSELLLLRRNWLFSGLSEDDLDLLMENFTQIEVDVGHTISSGSPETFLTIVSSGQLNTSAISAGAGQWLGLELALTGRPPTTWTAEVASRVLTIRASDLNQVLRQNAELTRFLYTNLTLQILANGHNPLKNIAV